MSTQTLPRAKTTPVGTGSHPTVPGLPCPCGVPHTADSDAFTVGGTKNVLTLPVRGLTRSTSLAPPSATRRPRGYFVMLNGLDRAS